MPENQVIGASVFEITGIDLAGPLYFISDGKFLVLLFTCHSYSIIHLNLLKNKFKLLIL